MSVMVTHRLVSYFGYRQNRRICFNSFEATNKQSRFDKQGIVRDRRRVPGGEMRRSTVSVSRRRMTSLILPLLIIVVRHTASISIPFVQDHLLRPSSYWIGNTTIRVNSSCDQCLCDHFTGSLSSNSLALNCFPNGTCEYFQRFPKSYQVKSVSGATLYFLQGILPNASTCCAPNITEILDRLKTATPMTLNLTLEPASFGYDERKTDEAVVITWTGNTLVSFNPLDLTVTRNSPILTGQNVALYNEFIFTSNNPDPVIFVLDKQNMTLIANMTYPTLEQTTKYLFVENGKTVIATAQHNNSLTVFHSNSPTNYTFQVMDTTIFVPIETN